MPKKIKVAVTRRLPRPCEERLAETYDVTWGDDAKAYTPQDLAKLAHDAHGLIVSPAESINADAIAALPDSVVVMPTFSVGTDHIDLPAAKARRIVVTNTPGVLTEATADIALLLLLGTLRRASEGERMMRAGSWIGWRPTQLMGAQLAGRTLGIVGMGRIGLAVAQRARAFGMKIVYHNRKPAAEAAALNATYFDSVDAMLPKCDVLSLHCPMTPDTKNLLDARRLALLPRGAFIINTARGGHVVDDCLIDALKSGQIAGAGLDVYAGEPNVDARYAALPNVFLLPHLGSATQETRLAMGMMVVDNLDAVLNGRPALNPV